MKTEELEKFLNLNDTTLSILKEVIFLQVM